MNTLEIRAGEGGIDAESFADELTGAIEKALVRDPSTYVSRDGNVLTVPESYPQWL